MAEEFVIRLFDKKIIAFDTMAFIFDKPNVFNYIAGQSMDLTIINPKESDEKGNTRTFSIASSPFEDRLMIATRISDSAFKKNLKNLKKGTIIKMTGPYGKFTLPDSSSVPVVFLNGGIGVTPARSIITNALNLKMNHRIYLFYSMKTPEHGIFANEFLYLQKNSQNFTFVPTITRSNELRSDWDGETGHISIEMLDKYLKSGIISNIYFISGPMEMVSALSKMLTQAGIKDKNIRTEDFPGY